MHLEWTSEKLDWYVRASRAAGFHKNIADKIRPYLHGQDTLCDIGCGCGLIDLELAGSVNELLAIDVAENALAWLRGETERLRVSNIRAMIFDAEKLEAADTAFPPFDVALFCYFSEPDALMKTVLKRGIRLAFCAMHGDSAAGRHGKIGGSVHRPCAAEMDAFLRAEGFSFEKDVLELDFSQPFKSLDEARAFLESYAQGEGDTGTYNLTTKRGTQGAGRAARALLESYAQTQNMAEVENRLARVIKTSGVQYPYTLPILKEVALFRITP